MVIVNLGRNSECATKEIEMGLEGPPGGKKLEQGIVTCPSCNGKGTDTEGGKCRRCSGRGKINQS